MNFISTRNNSKPVDFTEALSRGLADDGGLFVPENFPHFKMDDFSREHLASGPVSFSEFATKVLFPFVAESKLETALHDICHDAFNFAIPLSFLKDDPKTAVLELFHGPTSAFKDVGARFLAQCQVRLESKGTVIVATSGDTGGAVASAFANQPGFQVVILYPKGKISGRQEKQLTSWGPSVRAYAVLGTFDDCQKLVKQALRDPALAKRHRFISANSISIGRLLPQMCYHAKASVDYLTQTGHRPTLIVPTGNLGNAVAALWAKRSGFPIDRVILATNSNRTLVDFFESGNYEPGATIATLANAMDVSAPSNFERLEHLYAPTESGPLHPSLHFLKQDVTAVSVTDTEIADAIKRGYSDSGHIWCPHTATAVVAKERQQVEHAIICATAHPAKFETIVEPLIGRTVPVPPNLAATLDGTSVSFELDANFDVFSAALV